MPYELNQTVSVFPPVFWCVRTRIILYAQGIQIVIQSGKIRRMTKYKKEKLNKTSAAAAAAARWISTRRPEENSLPSRGVRSGVARCAAVEERWKRIDNERTDQRWRPLPEWTMIDKTAAAAAAAAEDV